MEFTEQAAIALPGDRLLKGAALSPSGDVVAAWFAGSRGVRLYGESAPRDILLAEIGHAVGVSFLNEDHMEVVDAASGHVVRADATGAVDSRKALPGARQATAAARIATGWVLAITGSDSTPSHLRLPRGRGTWVPDSSHAGPLGLSGDGRRALVWQTLSPFRAWRSGTGPEWRPAEFEPVSADWFEHDIGSAPRRSPALWSVTSAVAVGPGHLQTWANRGTDDRLLLWFDGRGRFQRYVHVQVPFGFVAAAAKAPVMLAVRTLNGSELVKYSWEQVSGATLQHKEATR